MKKKFDAILLLGLKLHSDGSPARELILRCEAAARCWKNGLAPFVIPCGGRTEGTPVSECEVMTALLIELGVTADAIRGEKQSLITVENFRNAKAMLGDRDRPRVLIVTSDYHMLRARLICRKEGLRCRGCKARIPREETRIARRKEPLHLIDFLLGYQGTDKPRPERYKRFMYRLLDSIH